MSQEEVGKKRKIFEKESGTEMKEEDKRDEKESLVSRLKKRYQQNCNGEETRKKEKLPTPKQKKDLEWKRKIKETELIRKKESLEREEEKKQEIGSLMPKRNCQGIVTCKEDYLGAKRKVEVDRKKGLGGRMIEKKEEVKEQGGFRGFGERIFQKERNISDCF